MVPEALMLGERLEFMALERRAVVRFELQWHAEHGERLPERWYDDASCRRCDLVHDRVAIEFVHDDEQMVAAAERTVEVDAHFFPWTGRHLGHGERRWMRRLGGQLAPSAPTNELLDQAVHRPPGRGVRSTRVD